MQKYVPLVKQNVMKLEVFILGEKEGMVEREKRGIEKGSRDRIEIERKETEENVLTI